jgi:deoxyribodipyrimidine photo-lyase
MKIHNQSTGLYWFRHDCRINDMPALNTLSETVDILLCVYVIDDEWFTNSQWQSHPMGEHRWRFLCQGLVELNQSLTEQGNRLVVVNGTGALPIQHLIDKFSVSHLGYSEHCGVYEKKAIEQIALSHPNLKFITSNASHLYEPPTLPFSIDSLPDSFSAFRRKVEKRAEVADIAEELTHLPPSPDVNERDNQFKEKIIPASCLDTDASSQGFRGGEKQGVAQLNYYLFETDLVARYKETRNGMLGWDFSSKLSAWLSAGHLSPRYVFKQLQQYEQQRVQNDSTYWLFFELLWREFFHLHALKVGKRLFDFGGVQQQKPNTVFNAAKFTQWCLGKTGFDIVDACMRELNATGFMSNRGRQLVASCFVHELGLDWRYGAAYFEQQLIDFDVASNYGNWQYLAGVGCDPRGHRQFNLQKQTQQYDPNQQFRKAWLRFD